MPGDDLLYPPVSPSPWWWALVAGLLVVATALLVLAVTLRRRAIPSAPPVQTVAGLREDTLRAIDGTSAAHADGRLTPTQTCQELSRLVREFIGRAGDGDADFATASQLRTAALLDHRLEPTARFTAEIQDACFSPAATPDVDVLSARAREVVRAWR